MSSHTRPTVFHRLSPIERCLPELLEQVVLFAEDSLPGPPSNLLPLRMTSKTMNFVLSPDTNSSIYSRIFALKFDTTAVSGRLSGRWRTSRCRTAELLLRFQVLNRLRRGNINSPLLMDDLWTVFLILLEHDHKNAKQLTEWAKVHIFALLVAQRWSADGYAPEFGENVGGVVCRIIWELVREAELTEPVRRELQRWLYPRVIRGYQLSSFYASEEFFRVKGYGKELEERIRGHPPASMRVQYYGHSITVAAPPLASACLSVFILAMQPNALRYTPGGMEQYIPGRTFSQRVDDEWFRLVNCHNINVPHGLSGKNFTPSSLVGSWTGIVLAPQLLEFEQHLHSGREPSKVPFGYFDSRMELREHHCLGDETCIFPGLGPDGIAEDPLNAWFPPGATFDEDNDTLEIYDPIEDHTATYETYRTDAEHPYVSGYVPETLWYSEAEAHQEEDLMQLGAEIIDSGPDIPDETQGLANEPSYIDDDEQWSDTVSHRDSGIRDIIITGTMQTGDHEHLLRGRIRDWDGLIILSRLPGPSDHQQFIWVFRGYVHAERHIIGRWKQASTPFGEIGWEGGFMFSKQ